MLTLQVRIIMCSVGTSFGAQRLLRCCASMHSKDKQCPLPPPPHTQGAATLHVRTSDKRHDPPLASPITAPQPGYSAS